MCNVANRQLRRVTRSATKSVTILVVLENFMEQDSFGNWLKRKRKALDLTQAELGDQVGCSAAAIRKIEAEERRPSVKIVAPV